jgi:BirA family biotin operon repressor/biotin-[acetyl-CoA-carboxylase] ligase
MDEAARAADAQAPAGYVAIAAQQTAGRGRRGHAWSSPAGAGLYFSYLARPTRHIELVTLAAGVGVRDGVIAATGLVPHLKWPNDLLCGSRKLAGLLSEAAGLGTHTASVVVGVGLNLTAAAYPPDIGVRATNLETELGCTVRPFDVFVTVLEHLVDALRTLDAGDAGDILRRWRDASPLAVGARVRRTVDGRDVEGVTAGLDHDGALLVRTPDGLERIMAGELQWQIPDS